MYLVTPASHRKAYRCTFRYVELVRWSKAVPGTKGLGPGVPVLISQGVNGVTLQDLINDKDVAHRKSVTANFDARSVSEAIILALLTMPEDGKPDNYVCEPIEKTGKFRVIGVDNDHAFAPPVATEKGHKELKVCAAIHLKSISTIRFSRRFSGRSSVACFAWTRCETPLKGRLLNPLSNVTLWA